MNFIFVLIIYVTTYQKNGFTPKKDTLPYICVTNPHTTTVLVPLRNKTYST